MSEQEPVETTLPWAQKRTDQEQVDYERRAIAAMTKPGDGKVHPMSIVTPTYEPNRAMAPDPKSIIEKKGMKPRKEDTYAPVTFGDKVVYAGISVCVVLIIVVSVALFNKLG